MSVFNSFNYTKLELANMIIRAFLTFLFTFLTNSILAQGNDHIYIHPFSNSIGITLEAGGTYSETDFNSNRFDYSGRGMIEYFFNSNSIGTFGLRIHGGLSYVGGEGGVLSDDEFYKNMNRLETTVYHIGGGYSYTISLSNVIHPYLFAGLSYIQFYPRGDNNVRITAPNNNKFAKDDINYDVELGTRLLIHDNFSLNINGMLHYNPNDNLDGIWGNNNDDIYYSANFGISYYFNDARDSDADGIEDSEDFCPDTPPHLNVDQFGCPIDSDNDGVPDQLDLCRETPIGIVVDSNGCPLDLDKDGVIDNIDQCLYTPTGVEVDSVGCPIDLDNDGVPNYLDKCPQTPIGYNVNSDGCPELKIDSSYSRIILSNFNFGERSLPDSANNVLNMLIDYINDHPQYSWSIEGHSDSISVDCENNFRLSVSRAKSVYNHLVEKGINKEKLSISGFSHFRPIADNHFETGRKLNRRVEIIKH